MRDKKRINTRNSSIDLQFRFNLEICFTALEDLFWFVTYI